MPVSMPISTLKGNWQRLAKNDRLKRSSQVLSIINGQVCIFGGEIQPRQPVDDKVDIVTLNAESSNHETKDTQEAPSPRVGTASAVIKDALYIFSGRGGVDMAPVDENGAVWSFSPADQSWTRLVPADTSAPVPPARSYHSATSDGSAKFYIHAGCPASGRLSDLWAFDVAQRSWTQLPDAPAPHRGGTSIAFSDGKLFRMNGFDGQMEVGGSIDVFDISSSTWSTKTFKADGNDGPEARSVCTLLPVQLGRKQKLLTLFGERDPSSLGHAGAGKMLGDVWIYDINEEWWTKLDPNAGDDGKPANRGWFDADVVKGEGMGNDSVVVHGGLGEDNERNTTTLCELQLEELDVNNSPVSLKAVPLTIIKGAGNEYIPIPAGESAIVADFHSIQTQTKDNPTYLTSGFYRIQAGPTRNIPQYTYEETKYVLNGQIDVLDEATGVTHHLVAGDFAFFHVGSKAQFSSKSGGTAFFAVTRPIITQHPGLVGREEKIASKL
ncbi:hypothetical protein OPT61_g4567 [Boeremia exigua]|uniref:Uncharacterized protein n=1 Tax=Boeremia exigua TaxID=749465 RepID=A0ACC2IDN1_9PLEO|nr:hypothetical protein OPT61_g4567 [Boeremia exigua]